MALLTYLTDAFYTFTIVPYIANHKYRTGKYGDQVNEKFGIVPKRCSKRKCLLVHAVSVGEVIATKTVIDEFLTRHPEWDVHITTSTATGRKVAEEKYGADRVSFYPLDLSGWIKRFFNRIKPDAIILMELEVWPNFLTIASEREIPVIVANARITEKSAAQYKKFNFIPMIKKMLNLPSMWLAQTEEYAHRLSEIGVEQQRISISGNVKYDTVPTTPDAQNRIKYRNIIGAGEQTKVIVCGSTHPSEEAVLLVAYGKLKNEFNDLKLVLVPRHPHRNDEVRELTQEYGGCALRSQISTSTDNDIILVDTMGELSCMYAAADAVFVGGTFIEHGGQNMMEPCGLGIPTVIGPSYYNFAEAVDVLLAHNGIYKIAEKNILEQTLTEILRNPQESQVIAQNGRDALLELKGASAKTIDCLEDIINFDD